MNGPEVPGLPLQGLLFWPLSWRLALLAVPSGNCRILAGDHDRCGPDTLLLHQREHPRPTDLAWIAMAKCVCGASDWHRASRVPGPGAGVGEVHLRQILSSYAKYYNEVRTHLALGKDAPLGRAVQRSGVIVAPRSGPGYTTITSGYNFRKGQDKDAPLRRAVQRCGTIVATPILSGLHHQYARI
jgi:hypothetical protein